jgi:hypothetical protein
VPNGFDGSREGWERIAAPLREIDEVWDRFAHAHALHVTRDARSWPERSLRSAGATSEPQRLVQVYLRSEESLTYSLWVCAWSDRGGKHLVRKETLVDSVAWPEIRDHIDDLLERAFTLVTSWRLEDLEHALDLPRLPGR